MRAMITGASGFIGSRLAVHLVDRGVSVEKVRHRALERDFADVGDVIGKIEPDIIFHLAGTYQAPRSSEMIEANCLFAAKLLDALRLQKKKCRIVMMGSAAEYGTVEESALPIREDHPARPETLYGICKLSQTQIGIAFAREGMDVVIARTFNALGVGMPDFLAIPGFACQLRNIRSGKAPAFLKTGNLDTRRDFISVDSCVQALWLLGTVNEASGRIFNVCSGKSRSIRSIVNRMIDIAGLNVRMETDLTRMRRNDPGDNYGDPSLLRSTTGFVPVLSDAELDEILNRLLDVNVAR